LQSLRGTNSTLSFFLTGCRALLARDPRFIGAGYAAVLPLAPEACQNGMLQETRAKMATGFN